METKKTIIRQITPVFRVAFPQVFEAKSYEDGEPKFNLVMLFPKDYNMYEEILSCLKAKSSVENETQKFNSLKAMRSQALKDEWGMDIIKYVNAQYAKAKKNIKIDSLDKLNGKHIESYLKAMGFKMTFRDGAEKEDLDGYKDHVFAVASTKIKPQIVDGTKPKINGKFQEITREEEFYPGCYARASLTIYSYNRTGNKGVAFGLCNLIKVSDGETFAGKVDASDEFAEFGSEDETAFEEGSEFEESQEEQDTYSEDEIPF